VIVLDGKSLTMEAIVDAAEGDATVAFADDVMDRLHESRAFAEHIASTRQVYGFSTGVGANRNVELIDQDKHVDGLLRSHSTSAGALRSPARVRAMLVVRLNQLTTGHSGVEPHVVEALRVLFNAGTIPPVRELGGVGTGDLSALATTALAVHETTPFGRGSALPFISSNAASIGDAALAVARLQGLAQAAVIVAAASHRGLRGNAEAFSTAVEQATPFEGSRQVCRLMRDLVDGGEPARVQDPYGLRALPQVQGALLDVLGRLQSVVVAMANVGSENPILSPTYGVAHHGAFHAAYLAQSLDHAKLAACQSAQLVMSRLSMLQEPELTGLSPFLGDGSPAASGTMVVEYVAAAAVAEIAALAAPVSLQTATLSRGVEEDASFAALAARQTLELAESYEILLGTELLAAVRASRLGGWFGEIADLLPAEARDLPPDMADRDLTHDVSMATELVRGLAHRPPAD
jgi:histidine ammonia-lyase